MRVFGLILLFTIALPSIRTAANEETKKLTDDEDVERAESCGKQIVSKILNGQSAQFMPWMGTLKLNKTGTTFSQSGFFISRRHFVTHPRAVYNFDGPSVTHQDSDRPVDWTLCKERKRTIVTRHLKDVEVSTCRTKRKCKKSKTQNPTNGSFIGKCDGSADGFVVLQFENDFDVVPTCIGQKDISYKDQVAIIGKGPTSSDGKSHASFYGTNAPIRNCKTPEEGFVCTDGVACKSDAGGLLGVRRLDGRWHSVGIVMNTPCDEGKETRIRHLGYDTEEICAVTGVCKETVNTDTSTRAGRPSTRAGRPSTRAGRPSTRASPSSRTTTAEPPTPTSKPATRTETPTSSEKPATPTPSSYTSSAALPSTSPTVEPSTASKKSVTSGKPTSSGKKKQKKTTKAIPIYVEKDDDYDDDEEEEEDDDDEEEDVGHGGEMSAQKSDAVTRGVVTALLVSFLMLYFP